MAAAVQQEHAGDAAATTDDMQPSIFSSSDSELPLLAFHRHNDDMHMFSVSNQTLHKNLERYGHLRRPGNLYWSTPQGWMLIMEYPAAAASIDSDGKSSSSPPAAYLWNPRTGGKLPLPNIQEHHVKLQVPNSKCLLTHRDPAHPGCVVVILLLKDGAVPHMWFCRIARGGGWRCYAYEIDTLGIPIKGFISVVTACRGKLYFINSSESMGTIDFSSTLADNDHRLPTIQYFDVPRILFPHGMGCANRWLVESQDQLFLIYMFFVGQDSSIGTIHAYKMDFSARAWRRVHDIGDLVVFIKDTNVATSCAASPVGLKGNKIYFIKYLKGDGAYL